MESGRHNTFVAQLYRHQESLGRLFLHIQPNSTHLASVATVKEGLETVPYFWADLPRDGPVVPAQNPQRLVGARVATNSAALATAVKELHDNTLGDAVQAAVAGELALKAKGLRRLITVRPGTEIKAEAPDEEESHWQQAWDDVSGQELVPSMVAEARATELAHVHSKRV